MLCCVRKEEDFFCVPEDSGPLTWRKGSRRTMDEEGRGQFHIF
jgi:hypothetical protein